MSMYVYACMYVYRIQQGWVMGYDCMEWEPVSLLHCITLYKLLRSFPKILIDRTSTQHINNFSVLILYNLPSHLYLNT